MRKLFILLFCSLCALSAGAQVTVSGKNVLSVMGTPLFSGQWCFSSTCLTVTNGRFSGSVTAGTQTVTIKDGSSATILTVTGVTILTSPYSWDGYTVPYGASFTGNGQPYLACQLGAVYAQLDPGPPYPLWDCIAQSGLLVWQLEGIGVVGPGVTAGLGVPTLYGVVPTIYIRTDVPEQYNLTGPKGTISNSWTLSGGSGSMTWPGAAGIPNYSGSNTWLTSYSGSNPIPANYLPVATGTTFGTVKPDNTSCTVTLGVLSCTGGAGGVYLPLIGGTMTGAIAFSGSGTAFNTITNLGGVAWSTGAGAPSSMCDVDVPGGSIYVDKTTQVLYQCYLTGPPGLWAWHSVGGGAGVTSVTGDGALINNAASTGGVTLTLGNAGAHTWWGNPTGSTGAPGYGTIGFADLPEGAPSSAGQVPVSLGTSSATWTSTPSLGVANSSTGSISFNNSSSSGSVTLSMTPGAVVANLLLPDAGGTLALTSQLTSIPLSSLATQAADSVVMNASGTSASPTAYAMPTCTTGADLYNTSTHAWTCVSTGGGGVTSFTGDGALLNNSASTGAVTATLANAGAHQWWGNNTASSGAPGYESIGTADLPAIPLSGLTTQTTNTVVMNATGSTAVPTAVTMPTCTSGADLYNTSTHSWSCVSVGGSGTVTVVGAGSLTSTALVTGGGSQTLQTPSTTSTLDSSGNLSLAAGGSIGSADTGTPKFTFSTSKITANQPMEIDATASGTNDALDIFDANLTSGNSLKMTLGHDASTRNAYVIGYFYNAAGDFANALNFSYYGSSHTTLSLTSSGRIKTGDPTLGSGQGIDILGELTVNSGSVGAGCGTAGCISVFFDPTADLTDGYNIFINDGGPVGLVSDGINAYSASYNLGFGQLTLADLTTGHHNTAVGHGAGTNGSTALTSISHMTFLGAGANASTNGITNSTAVGDTAQVTASNQIVLGNTSVTTLLVPAIKASSTTSCLQISTTGSITNTGAACGAAAGTVTTTGSPASGQISEFSGSASITTATAAHLGALVNIARYDVLVSGGSSAAIGGVAPSSTSGLPFVSQGSSANPTFATLALSALAAQAADTVVTNASGSSTAPTAVAWPTSGTNGCAGASDAIGYNTSTHAFVCNTISGGTGTVTVVGAGSLTSTALVTGGGSQTLQTPSTTSTLDSSGNLSLAAGGSIGSADTGTPKLTFSANKIAANQPVYLGTTSNQLVAGTSTNLTTLTFPAPSGAVALTFPNTSELMVGSNSDTTTTHVLHATGVGGIGSFGPIATGDLPAIPLSGLATQVADTVVMNASGSTTTPTAYAMPTCTAGADLYNTSTHAWTCVSTAGSSTIVASAQYDMPYYSAAGTASTVTGTAIAGIVYASTSGAPVAASSANVLSAIGTGNVTNAYLANSSLTVNGDGTVINSSGPSISLGSSGSLALVNAGSGAFLGNTGASSAAPSYHALTATNAQTATYQVLTSDFAAYKTITVASGTFTVTMVASGSQPPAGQFIDIVNYGSGVVTIARSGQNINGGTSSLTLSAASATLPTSVRMISDGTNYFAEHFLGTGSGNATSINGATVPISANLLASNGSGQLTAATAAQLGTVINLAQYDILSSGGTSAAVTGSAISGFVFASTSGVPAAATAAQLGTLANIATGDLLYSGGTSSAIAGSGDFTFSLHTLTGGASAILDLSAASVTAGLKIPGAAGGVPTADEFIGYNTTNHTHVFGSNGTTLIAAAAATGTGTATTCSNQVVTALSGIAGPTCTTLTTAYLPTGTGSSNVPVGGVITGAGPTGGATSIPVITYNAAGQLTTVTTATPTVTVVNGKGTNGAGAGVVTGPSTSVNHDIADFTGTSGQVEDSGVLYTSVPQRVNNCGTTTTCANTLQASPRIVWGNATVSSSTVVITGMTAFTSTTSYGCTCAGHLATATACTVVNTSTSSITITDSSASDTVTYMCAGN